jgi:CRP-like cAMP-binding protein
VNPVPDPLRVFGPVPWREVRSLAGPVVETSAETGAELVREGELVATFSLIRSGSAEVRLGAITVGTLGPGDWFGESDPLARRPQPFTVVARTPMRLRTFSAFGIERLCAAFPGVRRRLLEFVSTEPRAPGEKERRPRPIRRGRFRPRPRHPRHPRYAAAAPRGRAR